MKNTLALFCFRFLVFLALWMLCSCNRHQQPTNLPKDDSDIRFAEQLKSRGSYDSAIIYFRKSIDKNLKINQYSEWVRSVSGMIDCYRVKGDIDEAMRITDQAIVIAKTKLDTTGNPFNSLIHRKAFLYSDKRQFAQAEALYLRNIRIYLSRSASPDTGLALSYNGIGTSKLLQNKNSEALMYYEKAIEIYKRTQHTNSPDYANSLQNIGIVYSYTGNYEKAEQYFLQSFRVKKLMLKPNDPQLASLYVNMGRFYQIVRNDSKAIEYMKLAENFYITQNQSNSVVAGLLFLNMGVIYIYTADYEKAQSYLNKSLEIISSKAPGDLPNLLTLYLNMGFIAEKKNEYETAQQYYLKGLAIGDKLPNSVKVLRGLANVSYKMKDKQKADNYYKNALQKSFEMYGKEHTETALTYLRYGDFLSDNANKQALEYLNSALELYKKAFGPVNIDVSSAYYYIGNYYYRVNEYKKAISFFQLSIIAGFPGFTSKNIVDNPDISKEEVNANLLDPLTAKAIALLMLYQSDTSQTQLLKSSAASFRLALNIIEMLRSTYQEEDSKLFISENEKKTFTNALYSQVELYRKSHDPDALEQAFNLAEKGKSAVLLSHLRDKEAKNIGHVPENLLAQDVSIKSEIFFYNKQIHDQKLKLKPDEEKISLWNSKIFDLSRKQDEFIKSLEKNYPVYYNMKYDNSVISIQAIQNKLTANQAIVEFSLSDSILFTFAITQHNVQLTTRAIDSSFFDKLQLIRQQLTGKEFNNYSGNDYKTFVKTSFEMYEALLLPLQGMIKGKDLIIIPDGELGYLSFDVLLTSMPDSTKPQYRKLPYLIRKCALSYAPSATTFFNELNLKNTKNNGRILAFGPDYSDNNAVLSQKDESGKLLRNMLSNLTNTQDEIKSLDDYFNVKAYIGKAATETSFKNIAGKYKVLHLAMHTIINNENPLYSKLIFFKPQENSTDDGMLNASELINIELHADMAVLSACNTGSGKMRKGEGIMSLSRDFFYAGVPGIIMTTWAVEDRSGIKLMNYFYKYIAKGKPRNEALQLAKIDYLDNCDNLTSHPHYWAAYMNVGDIRPIENFGKKTNPFSMYGAIASIFIISLLIFLRSRKGSNTEKHSG